MLTMGGSYKTSFFLLGAVLDALNKQNGSGSQVFMWDIHFCKQDNNRKTISPDLEMIIPSPYYFSSCLLTV